MVLYGPRIGFRCPSLASTRGRTPTRIPQRRLRYLAVLLCIALLPAFLAPANTAPISEVVPELPALNATQRARDGHAVDPRSAAYRLRSPYASRAGGVSCDSGLAAAGRVSAAL